MLPFSLFRLVFSGFHTNTAGYSLLRSPPAFFSISVCVFVGGCVFVRTCVCVISFFLRKGSDFFHSFPLFLSLSRGKMG